MLFMPLLFYGLFYMCGSGVRRRGLRPFGFCWAAGLSDAWAGGVQSDRVSVLGTAPRCWRGLPDRIYYDPALRALGIVVLMAVFGRGAGRSPVRGAPLDSGAAPPRSCGVLAVRLNWDQGVAMWRLPSIYLEGLVKARAEEELGIFTSPWT